MKKYVYIDKKTGQKTVSATPLTDERYELVRQIGKVITK
jgi:hypothetical protein